MTALSKKRTARPMYILQENGSYTVKKVAVKTGEEGDYYTEILSDELKEGDYIVSFPDSVNEGDTISIDLEMKAE